MVRQKTDIECLFSVNMIDKKRILRKLTDVKRFSERLSELIPKNFEEYEKSKYFIKAATERYLQLISDLELETLVILYKGMELSIAGEENSLINRFEEKLNKRIINGIKKRRVLSNILVHAYSDVNYDKQTFEQANNLIDVETFIREVKKLIKN